MAKNSATHIANVTKAIHAAMSQHLAGAVVEKTQTVQLKSTGSGKGPVKTMSGKISTPVQPSYYVAVIFPVYD